jgi:protein subunit release factor A
VITVVSSSVSTNSEQSKGALIELKSGVGGSESSLFLAEVMRMYIRLAERMFSEDGRRWKAVPVAVNETENGGVKDAIVEVKGKPPPRGMHLPHAPHRRGCIRCAKVGEWRA